MTRPAEFIKFHDLLVRDSEGYEPYYFPLEKNGKDPIKNISWKENRKSFEEAIELMEQGYNIGIAGTDTDKLVIIDVDDIKQVGELKPTLINQSRKRIGRHGFYFTDDALAKNIFDNSAKQNIATEEYGEVRANWQYVVAAGSYVPCSPEEYEAIPEADRINAGYYTVMVEHTVNDITFEEIPETYRICLQGKREADIAARTRKGKRQVKIEKEHKNVSALWSLDIQDVTGKRNNPTHRFPSLFHGSKTYKDTSVNHDLLHCWRHNVSHNAISTLAVLSGVSTCSDAGFGHNSSGTSALNLDDGEVVYKIWRYAKDHGYIPDDDPIPTKALVHYAVSNGICNEKEVTDGWKLPTDAYNVAIAKADFNTGRQPLTQKIKQVIQNTMNNSMQIAQALQNEVPIFYDEAGNYWMWNNTEEKYERIDETEILCQVVDAMDLDGVYKSRMKTEILECIRITGRKRRAEKTQRNWIQFKNCVVDMETCERFQATPDYFFVAPITHNFGKSEDTPTIDALFESWVGPERKELMYEICAYCMYDHYPIHRIFAFVGRGRNGKGQFMELIRRFLGMTNCTSTELDTLAKTQFGASKLFGKKAAFMGETNYSTLTKTNMLKQLSGGDLVSCEFKRKDAFDFHNTAKIIIATNSLPDTTDRTDGFYRRWLLVEFKNRFPEGKDVIDEIPEHEYENMCRKCIGILGALLKRGTFTGEGTVEERAKTYERLSNPVNTFIETSCKQGPDEYCPTWFLYDRYCEFQERSGFRQLSEKEFSTQVKTMGYEIDQKAYNFEMKQKLGYTEDDGKRSNWRTIQGISWSGDKHIEEIKPENEQTPEVGVQDDTSMHVVARVADVVDISVSSSYRENLSRISATSATSATHKKSMDVLSVDFKDLERFCNDWETLNRSSITKASSVGIAIEFAQKWKVADVDMVLATIRKMKGIA